MRHGTLPTMPPTRRWLAIALASSDPLFEAPVSGQARPAMLPRVRARLEQDGFEFPADDIERARRFRHGLLEMSLEAAAPLKVNAGRRMPCGARSWRTPSRCDQRRSN